MARPPATHPYKRPTTAGQFAYGIYQSPRQPTPRQSPRRPRRLAAVADLCAAVFVRALLSSGLPWCMLPKNLLLIRPVLNLSLGPSCISLDSFSYNSPLRAVVPDRHADTWARAITWTAGAGHSSQMTHVQLHAVEAISRSRSSGKLISS